MKEVTIENKLAQKADLVASVDASWMALLELVLQERVSARTAEAIRDMEELHLRAGLPAMEEISGQPCSWH